VGPQKTYDWKFIAALIIFKRLKETGSQWLIPEILATQEAEIRGRAVKTATANIQNRILQTLNRKKKAYL
jgi:hypothetical protein